VKVSIVTPSFNQVDFLRQTMRSILDQQGEFDLQWIVADGGSTDGSVELLAECDDDRLTFSSEPDDGQSDAINKALDRATGDVIGWLNSDDLYCDGTLAAVVDAFAAHSDAGWLVGRCDIVDGAGNEIRPFVTRYKNRALDRYSYTRLLRENFISQPAVFWRRKFGEQAGRLDKSLKWTMDYDLWLRMGRMSDPLIVDRTLSQFRLYQTSKTGRLDRRQYDEEYAVACRYMAGRTWTRWMHKLSVERTVWAYRAMRLLGR
jgi:glycosyltransferase involved in cell wall biosynthesis